MAEEGLAAGGVMDVNTALQDELKSALIHEDPALGISETAKPIHLCVLVWDFVGLACVRLMGALCVEHQINLIKCLRVTIAVIKTP